MTPNVRTVTGEISPEQLGVTLMHEHFLFGYPGYAGDVTLGPFRHEEAMQACLAVAERLKSHGVKTVVDATTNEAGRNPEFLRELSERSGLQIVCSTGYYYEGEGAPAYFKFRRAFSDIQQEVYEMMMTEITVGIAGTGIKAGVIKLASSKGQITDYEQVFFRAAARVQRETGVPIITHTQEGTMGPEQAELLISEGADPGRIMIGHMDGSTDLSYHLRTLKKGVSIAFDRIGLQKVVGMPMDEERLACLFGLIGAGYDNRLMLSHDTITVWLGRPYTPNEVAKKLLAHWTPTHLFENILPALRRGGVTEASIQKMLVENPKRLFGGNQ
jgi:phosphotriesterase-related protein